MDAEAMAQPSATGEQAATISREMVQLMRRVSGRGPTKARTTIGRDHVLVMFRETLTAGEQNLVDCGYRETVLGVRAAYQEVLREDATNMVERVLGRRVVGFMSSNHFEPDVAVEVFVLDPEESEAFRPPQEAEHSG